MYFLTIELNVFLPHRVMLVSISDVDETTREATPLGTLQYH